MTAPGTQRALRIGMAAAAALLVLQWIWHAWLIPPKPALVAPTLALASLPLLPGLWAALRSLRRGVLLCGIVCLFYFCHGVSELWSGEVSRWLPGLETTLTLIVIGALGWDVRDIRRAR